jgi:hypothetical protein
MGVQPVTPREYPLDGTAGVDFTAVDSVPMFTLGAKMNTSAGNTYRYVRFDAGKTAALVYDIDKDWEVQAGTTTTTAAAAPILCGVFAATVAVPAGKTFGYGWIQTAGTFPAVALLTLCAPDVELYTTATDGTLDDTATKLVSGLKNVGTAVGGATANRVCFSGSVEISILTA